MISSATAPTEESSSSSHAKPTEWTREQDERQILALRYWHVSRVWNGRTKSRMTIMGALYEVNSIEKDAKPNSPLIIRLNTLRECIVHYGPKDGAIQAANGGGSRLTIF